tara:strand:+ start:110 stop:331 length:222 start_codon:yes stop_codon:yes gene_type:complete
MTIAASISEEFPGFKVEVTIIPITRGFGATINYGVTVWAVSGNTSSVIPGGESMVPPEIIQNIKLKLWEKVKP